MQPCLLMFLVNEQGSERTVSKKTNRAVPVEFGDIQLLYIMIFPNGSSKFDITSKPNQMEKPIGFSLRSSSILRKNKPLKSYFCWFFFQHARQQQPYDKDFADFINIVANSLSSVQELYKIIVDNLLPTGPKTGACSISFRAIEQMQSFGESFVWYNK